MTIKNTSGKDVQTYVGMRVWFCDQTGRIVHIGNETVQIQIGITVYKGITREQIVTCR